VKPTGSLPAGERRLHLYVAATALGAVLAVVVTLGGFVGPQPRVDAALVMLGLATLCAEAFPVTFLRRRGSESFDVSSAFTLAALLVAGPAAAVAIQLVSRTAVELMSRRPAIKGVFNVAQKVLAVAAAGGAVMAVGAPTFAGAPPTLEGGAAFAAATAAYITVNGLLVTVVCALAAGEPLLGFLRRELLRLGADELAVALLAPIAVALVVVDPLLIPLLAVPAWALRRSGRTAAASYHEARHDALTGLPNRRMLREALRGRIEGSGQASPGFAIVVLGLDRLDDVTDVLGPTQADLLLRVVADRLEQHSGGCMVGRLESREFGLIVDGGEADAVERAEHILDAFESPLHIGGLTVAVAVSAGIAVKVPDVESSEELSRRAHVALRSAKREGTRLAVYDRDADRVSRRRLLLVGDLRRAIADGEIRPYFQPQLDLLTGKVVGAEALVRWLRPDGTLIPPMDFIGESESTGVIKPLTRHVLGAALSAQRSWAELGTPVRVAVNLSARSLLDPDLVDDVHVALMQAGVPASMLELEVTESAIMADADRARATLVRLGGLGVRLAIDDFGTGYSSLAYLSRLPVDAVKIDRSFVKALDSDPAAELIVRMTVDLGHHLGLDVVAEGIEDETCRDRLRALGCDTAQGFLWSPAVPAERFLATVARLPSSSLVPLER
jgi:diguanylate cyclase (GGDEF)-like protein